MITHNYLGKATHFIFKEKCLLNFTYTEQSRHNLELQSLPMLKAIGQGQVWSHVFKIYENLDSRLKY